MNLIGTITKRPFIIREIFNSEWTLYLNWSRQVKSVWKRSNQVGAGQVKTFIGPTYFWTQHFFKQNFSVPKFLGRGATFICRFSMCFCVCIRQNLVNEMAAKIWWCYLSKKCNWNCTDSTKFLLLIDQNIDDFMQFVSTNQRPCSHKAANTSLQKFRIASLFIRSNSEIDIEN